MTRSRAISLPVPFLLALLAACFGTETSESTGNSGSIGDPSFAESVDSMRLSILADQGVGLAMNAITFSMADGDPLVLWYGEPTPAAAHAMAMGYLQQAVRRGAEDGPASAASMAFRSLSALSTCTPTITGIGPDSLPIDSDADGVPDNWKIDYGARCFDGIIGAKRGTTYQGSIEFRDTGLGLKSARAIVKGFRVTEVGNEDWGTLITWADGDETVIFTPTLVTDTLRLVAGQSIPHSDSYFRQNFVTTFVPDSGKIVALGAPLPTGLVELEGTFEIVYDPFDASAAEIRPNYRMTLSTSSPVHLNFGCNGWVDAGTLVGRLNGDPEIGFQATVAGCGLGFGKEIFGATP